ncbi:MAG TPA: hypothetical protein VJU86_21480 [Pyrinomonadaceae bacterium]|nr:hypothetical protein [Pyrinomonadaceae bacterium]
MKKSILLLSVFAVIAATTGYGVRTALNLSRKGKAPAYTIVWQVTDYSSDGTSRPRYFETRYVSGNGRWHSLKSGDTKEEGFGEPGKGVFARHGHKLYFVSEYSARPVVTEEELMNSPDFLRVDNVLSYKAIVVSSGNRPRTGSEFYKVPALGGHILKIVIADSASGPKTVYEPISFTLGEPEASAVTMPNNLPVDFESIKERRHAANPRH